LSTLEDSAMPIFGLRHRSEAWRRDRRTNTER
jgi:hypothetical protein